MGLPAKEKATLFGHALAGWRFRARHDCDSSLLHRLLAEHHVYVRSGQTGRYVVLRWPWRAGVTLGLVAVAGWTGLASVGWLAAHLETRDQRRELARLTAAYHQLEAVTTAYVSEPGAASPVASASLVAELEEVKAGREAGIDITGVDAAQAEQPWHEPVADRRLAERLLPSAMQAGGSGSGRDWLYDRIARSWTDGMAAAAETIRLRAAVRAASAEIARLKTALEAVRRAGRTAETAPRSLTP